MSTNDTTTTDPTATVDPAATVDPTATVDPAATVDPTAPVATTDASQTVTTDTTAVAPVTGPSPEGSSTGGTASDPSPVTVQQSVGTATAQVQGPAAPPQSTVPVHETHVKADTVITDTSSPLAVQVPVEAQGDALTPIGRAYADARTPEDVFNPSAE